MGQNFPQARDGGGVDSLKIDWTTHAHPLNTRQPKQPEKRSDDGCGDEAVAVAPYKNGFERATHHAFAASGFIW